MKILQVVTLVTPEGAFGGPMRVALNQSRELELQGHDVLLVAGAQGFQGDLPTSLDGVQIRLFQVGRLLPNTGFAGITSLRMLFWAIMNLGKFDVVHVHLARDLVTLPISAISLLLKKKVIAQTHGMIAPSEKKLAKILDFFATKKILKSAHSILHLTNNEKTELSTLVSGLKFKQLFNGIPIPEVSKIHNSTESDNVNVLFLGRIHEIKRPEIFVEAARQLAQKHSKATFSLVGPDGGMASIVEKLIKEHQLHDVVRWEGSLQPTDTLCRLRRSDVFALPSRSEVMPMSVLEAMSVGLPVVVCQPCGLADDIASSGAGIVVSQSVDELVAAIDGLISSGQLREEMGVAGRSLAIERFGIRQVTLELAEIYSSA